MVQKGQEPTWTPGILRELLLFLFGRLSDLFLFGGRSKTFRTPNAVSTMYVQHGSNQGSASSATHAARRGIRPAWGSLLAIAFEAALRATELVFRGQAVLLAAFDTACRRSERIAGAASALRALPSAC